MVTLNEQVIAQLSDSLSDEFIRLTQSRIASWVALGVSEQDIAATLYITFGAMSEGYSSEIDEEFKKQINSLL